MHMHEGISGESAWERDEVLAWKGRAYVYGLLGVVLARPLELTWFKELLSDPFLSVVREMELSTTVQAGLQNMRGAVDAQSTIERDRFIEETVLEFQKLFLAPIQGCMVPLGASSYLPQGTDLYRRRAACEALYERFGFAWRESLTGTPGVWPNEPEHVILALPMLAILADEIASSLTDPDDLAVPLEQTFRDFLSATRDWMPDCLVAIEKATSNEFYGIFAQIARECLEAEYSMADELCSE